MAKMQKYLILFVVFFFACACSHIERKANKEPAPVPVKTAVIAQQTAKSTSHYVGVIEARQETPLSMQTTGRVLELGCRDGEKVRKNQVLVRVDSTQAKNALEAAEASLKHAEDGYKRAKQVHAKGGVTDQQMVEIESQLAQARSMFAAAKQQLQECTLRAPFDGVVSGLTLSVGQTVLPGMRLFSLLDISALTVRFSVPESEIGAIEVGQKGTMDCPAINTAYTISVTEKTVSANQLTHSYDVKAQITNHKSQITNPLMPGMVAKVSLLTTNSSLLTTNSPDIIIPPYCVLMMPQGPTVWVVEQGRAQRRNVVVDGYYADGVRITQGLHVGDTLIVEGYQKLFNNCRVTE